MSQNLPLPDKFEIDRSIGYDFCSSREIQANQVPIMTLQISDFPTGPSSRYFDYLRDGRFMIQRSRSTGQYTFYPRVLLPATGETDLEWVEASGRASVYSATRVPRKPERGGDYTVAIVELEEGPRMMTNIVDVTATEVYIGQPVTARIDLSGDTPRVIFSPTSAQTSESSD